PTRGRVGPLRTVAAGGTGAGQPTRAGWCGHVTRARCADATEAGYLAGPARCARPGRLEVRGTADAGRILPGTGRYVVHLGRVPGAQLVVRLLGVGGLVVEPALEVLPARDVAVEAAPDVLEVLVGERALRVPGYVRAHVVRLLLPLDVGDQPGRDLDRVHGLLQVLRAAGEPVRDALMVVDQLVEVGDVLLQVVPERVRGAALPARALVGQLLDVLGQLVQPLQYLAPAVGRRVDRVVVALDRHPLDDLFPAQRHERQPFSRPRWSGSRRPSPSCGRRRTCSCPRSSAPRCWPCRTGRPCPSACRAPRGRCPRP